MLLGASSDAAGEAADLGSVTAGSGETDDATDAQLIAFADAAFAGPVAAPHWRELLGEAAFVEAAATVAIFNGLVRTADATGIPLDDGTAAATVDARIDLGLNDFAGAANTDLTRHPTQHSIDISEAFR